MLVYKIENKINGKCYIGITEKSLEERLYFHSRRLKSGSTFHLYNAIRKYGEENFIVDIVEDNISSHEELLEKERYYVSLYDSYNNGYNMTAGGDSNPMDCDKSKNKHLSVMRSEEVRKKISNTMKNKAANGEIFTEEHRKHISESQLDWVFIYNIDGKIKRVHEKDLNDYLSNGWMRYIRRSYDQLCGREMMTVIDLKSNMFDPGSIACYCILDSGERYDFRSIRDASIWWFNTFHPFGSKFVECTYRRNINKSMNNKDVIIQIWYDEHRYRKEKLTGIKWFRKEEVMQ